jgi:hypothetical protein
LVALEASAHVSLDGPRAKLWPGITQLALLVEHVGTEVDRYRAGELDAFDIDQVIFQYSRAAKELWTFCNLADVETTANFIREYPPDDWWERGAPRKR